MEEHDCIQDEATVYSSHGHREKTVELPHEVQSEHCQMSSVVKSEESHHGLRAVTVNATSQVK